MELFKINPHYLNYEISSYGKIRNSKTNRFLKPSVVTKGYLSIELFNNVKGKSISTKVHRLVAETFIGKKFNKVIDHINNDKTDNRVENLQYVSNRYNIVKQKLYSNKGFIRKNKRVKEDTYTIEYRIPNEKRKSFTSSSFNECINHYCNVMKDIDLSVFELVRNFYK